MTPHLARTGSLLAVLGILGCNTPPTAPAVRFNAADVSDSALTFWCADFDLLDAAGGITTASGSLTYAIQDATGAELCRVVATAPAPIYNQTTWRATLCTTVPHTTCPRLTTAAETRVAVLTFTPTGGAPIVSEPLPTTARMFVEPLPAEPPPVIEPTPEATPPVVAEDAVGWLLVPALGAHVLAPGALARPVSEAPLGASDVYIIGASDDCRVQLARYPSFMLNGASTRATVASHGDSPTVDEVSADRWHLEYPSSNGYSYVSVGIIVGESSILCRADYPLDQPENLACAVAICTSLRVDAPPRAPVP